MLCIQCRECLQTQLASDKDETSQPSTHHLTSHSLVQAIDERCFGCSRFWEGLNNAECHLLTDLSKSKAKPPNTDGGVETSMDYATYALLKNGELYGTGCYLFQIGYRKTSNSASLDYWRAVFLLDPSEGAKVNIECQRLALNTGAPERLSLAKHWIRECIENRQKCKRTTNEEAWYPTRLLTFEIDESPLMRLVGTAQTRPTKKYMTLAHRWGPTEHIKLTEKTYSLLMQGLPLTNLPRLFQDAISICRYMGIGYLWIDSLCILQGKNNLKDWEHEESLMGNVYAHSFCNISAADVPDCSQSIFTNRDIRTIVPQAIDLEVWDRETGDSTKRFVLYDYKFWESEVSNALVNQRAWVLQERLLAPRILHFGRHQLIWECCEKDAAEVFPDGLPTSLSTTSSARFKQLDSSDYIHRVLVYKYRKADGLSAPHLLWHRIVEQYTASALTVPSDKLIACFGVAKRLSRVLQDDYVTGMWRRFLEGELLWVVEDNHQLGPCPRAREYRAPSWSSASIDGPVSPGEPRTKDSMITVEDYHLEYCTSDKTGGIRDGWIQVRDVLKRTIIQRPGRSQGNVRSWVMVIDNKKDDITKETSTSGSEPVVRLDDPEEIPPEDGDKGLLFYMCARSSDRSERNMYLLLLKLVDAKSGTFKRIGVAYASNEQVKRSVLEQSPTEASLPCLRYEGDTHSIRIV